MLRTLALLLCYILSLSAWADSTVLQKIRNHFPEITQAQLERLGKPLIDELAEGRIPNLIVLLEENISLPPLPQFTSENARNQAIQQRIHEIGIRVSQSQRNFKNWLATRQHAVTIRREYSHLSLVSVSVNSWQDIVILLNHPGVRTISSDEPMKRSMAYSLPLINQPVAIANGIDGSGGTVAVFDSGVDYTHSEFGSCTSPGVPASCRVLYTDDYAPDDGVLDDDGHGTFVSAIVAGVAEASNLVVFDVFDGASAYSSDVIDAINWAVANAATYNIVAGNFSLGNGQEYAGNCDSFFPPPVSNPYKSAFDSMRSVGIIPVVASGNEAHTNGISSPACVSSGFSVGATYNTSWPNLSWGTTPPCTDTSISADDITCFSNSGPNLDMLAPGSIISTVGTTSSGTSMAAPMVAGAVAVIRQQFPLETLSQIETRLKTSATHIVDDRNGLSFPRLDLQTALELIDSDSDGVLDLYDPAENDPCIPSQFAAPCSQDTDSDGITDAVEGEFNDSDNDGIPDYQESIVIDSDNDGVVDQHDQNNSDPCVPDLAAEACDIPQVNVPFPAWMLLVLAGVIIAVRRSISTHK